MKTQCKHCKPLQIETIATAPEGAALRLAGQTINDRVHSLHDQLEKLLTGMNETRVFVLSDMFVKGDQ